MNQNDAWGKKLSSLSESPKSERIRWKNHSFEWVVLYERHLNFLFENRWAMFSHEFQSIIARIHSKNNETCRFWPLSFRGNWTSYHSMTSQAWPQLSSGDFWLGFATVSWFLWHPPIFSRQHKRCLLIFSTLRQTEQLKSVQNQNVAPLNVKQRKTMEFGRPHALGTPI